MSCYRPLSTTVVHMQLTHTAPTPRSMTVIYHQIISNPTSSRPALVQVSPNTIDTVNWDIQEYNLPNSVPRNHIMKPVTPNETALPCHHTHWATALLISDRILFCALLLLFDAARIVVVAPGLLPQQQSSHWATISSPRQPSDLSKIIFYQSLST